MPITELLSADRIALLAEPGDRDTVLDATARLLADSSPEQTSAIARSLRQRERLGSTAIGHGVAIPHGRSDAYDHARAAFVRLAHPVEFGAGDHEPVDLVFAMAVPEHFTQQHLQWLAELAERFSDAGYRAALRNAASIEELRRLVLASPVTVA